MCKQVCEYRHETHKLAPRPDEYASGGIRASAPSHDQSTQPSHVKVKRETEKRRWFPETVDGANVIIVVDFYMRRSDSELTRAFTNYIMKSLRGFSCQHHCKSSHLSGRESKKRKKAVCSELKTPDHSL